MAWAAVCVFCLGLNTAAGATVFVEVGGVGGGTSWADALGSIQAGINAAFPTSDEVWVEKGTYFELITLKAGVEVYGGFLGTEGSVAARPPFPRPAIDPDASIIDGGSAESVVAALSGLTATARLDGFTVQDGRSEFGGGGVLCNGSSPTIINNTITLNTATRGAGIYCVNGASPAISANVITENDADDYGGGICCETSSSPTITGNTITDNTAGYYGGGIDTEFDSSPEITLNTITGNGAGNDGGGIFVFSFSNPNIAQNTIEDNSAAWYGGGIYCYQSNPTIFRNLIRLNAAGFSGGIYCYYASSPTTTDNIIDQNTAGTYGGGVCLYYNCSPILTNNTIARNTAPRNGAGIACIIWCSPPISNNAVAFNSSGILAMLSSIPVLRNNDVYNTPGVDYDGLVAGVGDISSDPLFVNAAGGDYHLTAGSPCRNAGWNGAPALPAVDYDGNPRTQEGTVDIGAFEFSPGPGPVPAPVDIPGAKSAADGSVVQVDGVAVTATRTDFFYVETSTRASGIRVRRPAHACAVGSRVNLTGTMRTCDTGERYLDASAATACGTGTVQPVALNGGALTGTGLDCTGLLVRTCGRVTSVTVSDKSFKIECAQARSKTIVTVRCVSGTVLPQVGWFVTVTGVCSRERQAGAIVAAILTCRAPDVIRAQ
jgi:parallel beta-helix repeat protein